VGPTEQARDRLLTLLDDPDLHLAAAVGLAESLAGLEPTSEQAEHARDRLLTLLDHPNLHPADAGWLADSLARFGPIANAGRVGRTALTQPRVGDVLRKGLSFRGWVDVLAGQHELPR
jgi:hypothetical protein